MWVQAKQARCEHKAQGSEATDNASAKHKARGSEATKNASAKQEVRESKATKNGSAKSEEAKQPSSPAGLAWRNTKWLARLVYNNKRRTVCLSVCIPLAPTVLDQLAWNLA